MLAQKKEPWMSDDLMLGRKIKGYQIAEVLGRGGMGCVYRAQHPLIGKQVAIKILQGAQSPAVISRFVLEAKAVNDIRHENLIDILDFDQLEEGNPYIIMEYLEGRSLDDAIQEGPFPLEQVGHIGLQLCSALSAAHQKGIIHRDLKGDNIFLINRANQQNFVKVLDFGIAKLLDATDEQRKHHTEANSLLGTPLYMAPEQITGQPIDARTDIYALGVLLYQMVVGHPPFDAPSPMVLLAMHVTAIPPPPRQFVPDLPAALEATILKCLQKEPAKRYESMSQLAEALGEACDVDPTLYLGNKLMSQRLFTAEATVVKATALPNAFAESPAELGAHAEDPRASPTNPKASFGDTTPNVAPEGGWESIDQLIASIDANAMNVKIEDSMLAKIAESKPTTQMTRAEILSITTGEVAIVKKINKPNPKTSWGFLLLIPLLLFGAGFGAWYAFLLLR